MTPELDFEEALPAESFHRGELLREAATALDRLGGQLGPGGDRGPSDVGDFARAFAEDLAEAQRPQIYRLDAALLDRERTDVPVGIDELVRVSNFYWLSLPVSLWARPAWGFNRLEAKVEFDPESGGTTFDLLPDQEFATRFQVNSKVALGVDAGMRFSATVPAVAIGVPEVAGVDAEAAGEVDLTTTTELVVGPFDYRVTAPKVKHSPAGLDHAFWRLDGAQYVDERDPGLRVVLRVPKDSGGLGVTVRIQARRYFSVMNARFQEAVQGLPTAIANFFTGGTPLGHSQTWDLSKDM